VTSASQPPRPTKNPWLRMSPLPRAIGVVLVVIGGVWLLQGFGFIQGSVMSGNALWGLLGIAFLAGGIVVLYRWLNKAKADIANDPE
jgi:hypothetical protein